MLEVANRLELERVPLYPVGKALLVIKGGGDKRQEVGLKQGSVRSQGKDYLGQETNLWKENQYFVVSKIKFTSWPLHGRWSLHR